MAIRGLEMDDNVVECDTLPCVAEVFEEYVLDACENDVIECVYQETGEFIARFNGKTWVMFIREKK
jgi:hypothetical protein